MLLINETQAFFDIKLHLFNGEYYDHIQDCFLFSKYRSVCL